MRFRQLSIALGATALLGATAASAQSGMDYDPRDTGWGDMGRSSDYYDFREPGRDRYYDRYSDDLRDRGDRRYPRYERDMRARRDRDGNWLSDWYDERRDWFQADRSDGDWQDRGWGDMGRSSEYYDFRDPGPDRYYERYRDDLYDRGWTRQRYPDRWGGRDRYSEWDDYPPRAVRGNRMSGQERRWRDSRYDDATAGEYDPDFGEMDVRDHAQWNERSYRGSANRGLREGMR
jgi:hypothetical protein